MRAEIRQIYEFDSFRLDLAERQLLKDGTGIRLTPKAFDVLALLVAQSGHLVEKEELMSSVWPDSIVEESNISRIIHTLRHVLGENQSENKFIETVAKKGYRFVAEVKDLTRGGDNFRMPSVRSNGLAGSKRLNGVVGSVANEIHHFRSEPRMRRRTSSRVAFVILGAVIIAIAGIWYVSGKRIADTRSSSLTPQTNSAQAYQHYERGRFLIEKGGGGDIRAALASFEKAIELDPNYAGGYAGKADAKTWMFWNTPFNHDDIVQARSSAEKAVELDASNSHAHTILCRIKATYDWDFNGAERECRRAVELDPNDHEAHREMAFFYNVMGREDEAVAEMDSTVSISMTAFDRRSRALILYFSRRYDEAIEEFKKIEASDPDQPDTRKWLMNAYEMKHDFSNALEARVRQMEYDKASPDEISAVRNAFARDKWPGVLRLMINSSKPPSMATATAYAQLGESDNAFEALNNLFERHAIMLITCAREPRLDPIRNDPRFDDLVRRIGLK